MELISCKLFLVPNYLKLENSYILKPFLKTYLFDWPFYSLSELHTLIWIDNLKKRKTQCTITIKCHLYYSIIPFSYKIILIRTLIKIILILLLSSIALNITCIHLKTIGLVSRNTSNFDTLKLLYNITWLIVMLSCRDFNFTKVTLVIQST